MFRVDFSWRGVIPWCSVKFVLKTGLSKLWLFLNSLCTEIFFGSSILIPPISSFTFVRVMPPGLAPCITSSHSRVITMRPLALSSGSFSRKVPGEDSSSDLILSSLVVESAKAFRIPLSQQDLTLQIRRNAHALAPSATS